MSELIKDLIQREIDQVTSRIERSYNQQDSLIGSCPHQPNCSHCGNIADRESHHRDQQRETLEQLNEAIKDYNSSKTYLAKDIKRVLQILESMTQHNHNLTDSGGRIVSESDLFEIETILEQ